VGSEENHDRGLGPLPKPRAATDCQPIVSRILRILDPSHRRRPRYCGLVLAIEAPSIVRQRACFGDTTRRCLISSARRSDRCFGDLAGPPLASASSSMAISSRRPLAFLRESQCLLDSLFLALKPAASVDLLRERNGRGSTAFRIPSCGGFSFLECLLEILNLASHVRLLRGCGAAPQPRESSWQCRRLRAQVVAEFQLTTRLRRQHPLRRRDSGSARPPALLAPRRIGGALAPRVAWHPYKEG